jgi:hypothetical protein
MKQTSSQIRRIAVGSILVLLLPLIVGSAKKDKDAAVEAFFERARTLTDIQGDGAVPYRLDAVVSIPNTEGSLEGHYIKVFQSKDHWRDELTFPRYSQLRVTRENMMWRRRNTNHQPLQIIKFLMGMNNFASLPQWREKGSAKEREEDARTLKCVNSRSDLGTTAITHEICFDSASGLPARIAWSDWDTVWNYSDYFSWNGKQVPRIMRVFEDRVLVSETRITKLEEAQNLEPSTFDALSAAEEWPSCQEEKPPTFPMLNFPLFRRTPGRSPELTPILVELGADGRPLDIVVLRPAQAVQKEQALSVFFKQQVKFSPAKCGKVSVPYSLMLELPM